MSPFPCFFSSREGELLASELFEIVSAMASKCTTTRITRSGVNESYGCGSWLMVSPIWLATPHDGDLDKLSPMLPRLVCKFILNRHGHYFWLNLVQ